jgi:hypothetical protein
LVNFGLNAGRSGHGSKTQHSHGVKRQVTFGLNAEFLLQGKAREIAMKAHT